MKIDQVKVTFRGYAGHCCVSHKCLFHLNSLLEYKDKKIVVSTVGLYVPDFDAEYVKYEPLNATDSYFETMAFWSNYNKFNDAALFRQIFFETKLPKYNRVNMELKANEGHYKVINELSTKLLNGEL